MTFNKSTLTSEQISKKIEHTNLSPFATSQNIQKLCEEAIKFDFLGVCVNPTRVKEAKKTLVNKTIVAVVGFPFGYSKYETKVLESKLAIEDGASEIDIVANMGMLLDGNFTFLEHEISGIAHTIHKMGATLKVIVETGIFTPEQIEKACRIIADCEADFVKMGTGYGPRGVVVEDVQIMHNIVGGKIGIKAAGGIATAEQAIELINAGASRIGSSKGHKIIESFFSEER